MKRREFFKNVMGFAGTAAIAPILLSGIGSRQAFAEEGRRKKVDGVGADSNMIDLKDPTAKAVGYVEISKLPEKKCSTCSLYVKTEKENGKEVGTCVLFPKKLVFAQATCNSWAKKA